MDQMKFRKIFALIILVLVIGLAETAEKQDSAAEISLFLDKLNTWMTLVNALIKSVMENLFDHETQEPIKRVNLKTFSRFGK
jgi:hypothetical protein